MLALAKLTCCGTSVTLLTLHMWNKYNLGGFFAAPLFPLFPQACKISILAFKENSEEVLSPLLVSQSLLNV